MHTAPPLDQPLLSLGGQQPQSRPLSLREAWQVAEASGIGAEALARCLNADDPHQAVLELTARVAAQQRPLSDSDRTSQARLQLREQLGELSLQELWLQASADGVEAQDETLDAEDPKQALIDLIARSKVATPTWFDAQWFTRLDEPYIVRFIYGVFALGMLAQLILAVSFATQQNQEIAEISLGKNEYYSNSSAAEVTAAINDDRAMTLVVVVTSAASIVRGVGFLIAFHGFRQVARPNTGALARLASHVPLIPKRDARSLSRWRMLCGVYAAGAVCAYAQGNQGSLLAVVCAIDSDCSDETIMALGLVSYGPLLVAMVMLYRGQHPRASRVVAAGAMAIQLAVILGLAFFSNAPGIMTAQAVS
eukprot:COSAG06_NODE_13143_length_1289_cov_0.859664_1_plen_364_part_10